MQKMEELNYVQGMLLDGVLEDGLVEKKKQLYSKLLVLSKAEESFFKQKARVQWLKEGNMNSKFFVES